jgi:rhodanese-related sulfurtransferase
MTIPKVDIAVAPTSDVYRATLAEPQQTTGQVSTEDVQRILADGSEIVLDSRKRAEYVAGHIAGAVNVAPPQGAPPADYVAAVERLLGSDKTKALVIYCNGQYCKAGRRLAGQLTEAGFTGVRRYQLGIPLWRALGLPVEIELEGILRIYNIDRTAVFFDARSPGDYAKGTIAGAHNVPVDEMGPDGIEKAPMPRTNFNTRIVLFGRDGTQARRLAEVIGKTPFHQNTSYFPGTYEELNRAIAGS